MLPPPWSESRTLVNYTAWLVEAFCIVAVNCYVLLSGYFLVESEWKPGRALSLLFKVLFPICFFLFITVYLFLTHLPISLFILNTEEVSELRKIILAVHSLILQNPSAYLI